MNKTAVKRFRDCSQTTNIGLRESALIGRQIVELARAEAKQLTRTAQEKLAELEKAARKAGFAAGRREAVGQILRAESLRIRVLQNCRSDILDMVFSVSEEVLGVALELQPDSISQRIQRALSRTLSNAAITIELCPEDIPYVRQSLDTIASQNGASPEIAIRANANLKQGNARLETKFGAIESSTEEHLRAIKNHLKSSADKLISFADSETLSLSGAFSND